MNIISSKIEKRQISGKIIQATNRLIAGVLFFAASLCSSQTVDFTSSNLPIVLIDTHGKDIRNSTRIVADMGVVDNGPGMRNTIDDPFNNYDGKIAVEIRGSSGQWKKWPKQQYGFETQTESGDNNNVSLLGLPAENDWILYPPYSDKSLLRNVLAYRLSNDIGRYAPRTKFCELVLNGDYRGIYVLIEKIKRDKNRVNMAKLRPEDIAGDQLTGGYIVKVDRPAGEENEGWESPYKITPETNRVVPWLYHDPGPDELTSEQKAYIKNYILDFEAMMNGRGWKSDYEQYFDVDAFVDYYLLTELSLNIDTYTFSTFFYKDRDSKGGRLAIGPVWDFNLAFGNADYFIGMHTEGWLLGTKIDVADRIPFWLKNLYNDGDVQRDIARRWLDLRTDALALPRLVTMIDAWADTLDEAQQRNFERWPILGQYIWPNYFVGRTFADEISTLKNWLTKRWLWLDAQFYRTAKVDHNPGPSSFHLEQNYPNPFNSATTIAYTVRRSQHVQLEIFNVKGELILKLVDAFQTAGSRRITWDGTRADGEKPAAGLYFCRLAVGSTNQVRRMILLP